MHSDLYRTQFFLTLEDATFQFVVASTTKEPRINNRAPSFGAPVGDDLPMLPLEEEKVAAQSLISHSSLRSGGQVTAYDHLSPTSSIRDS